MQQRARNVPTDAKEVRAKARSVLVIVIHLGMELSLKDSRGKNFPLWGRHVAVQGDYSWETLLSPLIENTKKTLPEEPICPWERGWIWGDEGDLGCTRPRGFNETVVHWFEILLSQLVL